MLINEIIYSRKYIGTNVNIYLKFIEPINEILKYCDYKLEKDERCEYIVTGEGLILEDTIEVETSFENIQNDIIEQIDQAEFIIWISVAWFTDGKLFNKLKEKVNQGVNVQLIINDDEINSRTGFDFETFFETFRKKSFGAYQDNIFHEKFCVIDLKTVINGSYNWTNKAMYNQENIIIIHNNKTAEAYAKRFITNKFL